MTFDLAVHEVRMRDAERASVVVKCLGDAVSVGDVLTVASSADQRVAMTCEIEGIEIFEGVLDGELEPNFNGLLHVSGALPVDVSKGWHLS